MDMLLWKASLKFSIKNIPDRLTHAVPKLPLDTFLALDTASTISLSMSDALEENSIS